MAEAIVAGLKKKLEKAESTTDILAVLQQINDCAITEDILRTTRIGKTVGKLRRHKDNSVATESSKLVDRWKQLLNRGNNNNGTTATEPTTPLTPSSAVSSPAPSSSSSSSSTTTTSTPPNHSTSSTNSDSVNSHKKRKTATPDSEGSSKRSSSNGDPRAQIVDLLRDALGESTSGDSVDAEKIASEIEAELYILYEGATREYKTKFRSIVFNLKKNRELRDSVMQLIIPAKKLCTMSTQDMASEELKKERKKIEEYHLEASKLNQMNQTSTDMFKCGKCGKRETTYYQMQTRSADEPMTTFHTCTHCGNRWKS